MKILWRAIIISACVVGFPTVASARAYHVPIIMYHEVVEIGPATAQNHYAFFVPPKIFEAELRYLKSHGYKAAFMKDVAAAMAADKPVPPRTVVLTFDDGTADFVPTVLPLLQKYNMRATLYANPGFNGKNDRMSWEDIMTAHRSGLVEVAAHTMTHQRLPELQLEMARSEIEDSKALLEHLIDAPVVSFAYPFGARSDEITEMVRSAGFANAVISDQRRPQNSDDLFAIPRIRAGDIQRIETFIRSLRQ